MSPAMNWAKFVPAELWPFTVMNQANQFPPGLRVRCLHPGNSGGVRRQDGAKDGIISMPGACRFDPTTMVGKGIACNARQLW